MAWRSRSSAIRVRSRRVMVIRRGSRVRGRESRRGRRYGPRPEGRAIFGAMPNRLAVALLLVLLPAVALGQQAPPFERLADVPALSDEAEISLLTMLPGREVYSLFGHTAFRVRDPALGLDRTYNYGTFDFDQPGFVLRFARGQLLYQLAVASFERTLAEYQYL